MNALSHKNNFDLLRICAAIFVIITHAYALRGLPEHDVLFHISQATTSFSRFGLWIFFVISGYLVTASAWRSVSVVSYIAKRVLRIMPAFIIVIFLSVLCLGPLVTTLSFANYFQHPITWAYLKALLVFRIQYNLPGVFEQNLYPGAVNGSLWTIPYEIFLYILPLCLTLLGTLKKVAIVFLFVLWIICIYAVYNYASFLDLHTMPFLLLNMWHVVNFAIFFIAGSIIYLLPDNMKIARIGWIIPLALWAISWFTPYAVILSYIFVPIMIINFAYQTPYVRIPAHIGDVSYGMYLYAFPIQQIIMFLTHGTLSVSGLIILTICIIIPIAWLSWHLVEKPALSFKRFFSHV